MTRKFDEVLEYFSRDNTLYPWDFFTSGTLSGTCLEKKDGSWYLKPGDTLELEVNKIGVLRNRVVKK
jgi:2-keto-4-pentenoate hydratase/2-oxohepta-3-ene-1,7-dioic acid hydratase in catechol pathway